MSRFRRLPRAAAALAMIPLAGLAVGVWVFRFRQRRRQFQRRLHAQGLRSRKLRCHCRRQA